jgi:uncharacterized protein (DUF433 family)
VSSVVSSWRTGELSNCPANAGGSRCITAGVKRVGPAETDPQIGKPGYLQRQSREMANLSDFEKLLPALSPGEKAQILKWVVQELGDAFPGIDSRPDVCGGEPSIVRTRIPVWLLEQARRLGLSEQALLAAYPSLRAEDLVNAWAYARAHAAEIEAQIRENEAD